MDPHIGGNAVPEITREEHDHSLSAKRVTVVGGSISSSSTVYIGTPTLYAVVNTGAAGDSTAKIGFATVNVAGSATIFAVVNTAAAGQASIVLDSGDKYIGLATVVIGNSISQPVTIQPPASGSLPVTVLGNVTLNSSVNSIGFATVNVGGIASGSNFIGLASVSGSVVNLAGTNNIGSVSILGGGIGINSGLNNIGFATVAVSTPTLYAVVNTGAAGQASVVLDSGVNRIGFATVAISTPTLYAVVNTGAAGQASVVLDNSINRIGFATVNVAQIAAGANYIGLASVNGSVVNLAGTANIGCVTLLNQPALTASAAFIGIVTVASTVQLRAGAAFAGLMTVVNGAGVANIGFVTVNGGTISANNSGTTKTLITLPINISTGSVATIAVPTNNAVIKMTNAVLGSNATTQFRMKSGVTYLTGNASLGITLFPGGGFTQVGSPDSPSWIGLPSGALVIEKFDTGGIISQISGHVVYFSE